MIFVMFNGFHDLDSKVFYGLTDSHEYMISYGFRDILRDFPMKNPDHVLTSVEHE